jgi:hypothetical protein
MRVAMVAAAIALGGCPTFDPICEVPHRHREAASYAKPLAHELGGDVLEIDLVVPEVVADMQMIRSEPWFPLLGRASPKRVLIWQRAPASYVVILPAQTEDVAKVAKLVDPM